ncbi:MAG: hypothetical protein ACYCW6_01620 [Candidatus Xenobia bacterium]
MTTSVTAASLLHLALSSPPLIGAAALAGLAGGVALECWSHVGRLAGGMAGGALGSGSGRLTGALGWQPSPAMQQATQKFSLAALPHKLMNPEYTGAPAIRKNPAAVEALFAAKPGDLLLVQHEGLFFGANMAARLAGASGRYCHVGMVEPGGKVLDLMDTGGRERTEQKWLGFTHLAVLRPHYTTPQEAAKVVGATRQKLNSVQYEYDFRLPPDGTRTDNKEYCTEFIYNRLREQAPHIHLEPLHFLGARFVTADTFANSPDIDTVYDSGSNFWLNHLTRFA